MKEVNNSENQSQLTSAIVQHYEPSSCPLHVDGATVVVAVVRSIHVVDLSHREQEARRQDGGCYGDIPLEEERRVYLKRLRWRYMCKVTRCGKDGDLTCGKTAIRKMTDVERKFMCKVSVDVKGKLYCKVTVDVERKL